MTKWTMKRPYEKLSLVAKELGISEVVAQVLINRGIKNKKDAQIYLNPSMRQLNSITKMLGVSEAYKILYASILNKEKIAIFGDYDVDGVMSTVILYKALKSLDVDVIYYIPHREEEGYGLNIRAINTLHEQEVDLIIACDNGIAALEEIKNAKALGLKVIVVDHHEPSFLEYNGNKVDVIPEADAVIDPKQAACTYPFKLMCAAGLSYRFTKGFFDYIKKPLLNDEELLIFATIATFCDIVDLQGENRILVKNGLELLNSPKNINIGLKALIKQKSIEGKTLGGFDIGFIIGPCINATGRLMSATLSVELFLTEDYEKAKELAEKLSLLNDERKKLTTDCYERALENFLQSPNKDDNVIVIYDEQAHESIAGIVAGRIKDYTQHPTIVLTKAEQCVKGSARSIESYNIFNELFLCRDLFLRFGGHAMAAGLSLEKGNIDALRKRLNANCNLQQDNFVEIISIDNPLSLSDVTFTLAEQLNSLEPFGKGNREPCFGSKNLELAELRVIEDKNTIIFTFLTADSYRKIKGVCFGKVEKFKARLFELYDEYNANKVLAGILRTVTIKMDIVYAIEINKYNNNVSVQLRIKDFRF